MSKRNYRYIRNGNDVDKELFASLLKAAKGSRTMKEFAEACGVQPSTFSRIVKKQNKGASSPELLESIVENAAPDSHISIEALARANGYELEENNAAVGSAKSGIQYSDLVCKIIMKELFKRNINGFIKKPQITSNLPGAIHLDLLIETALFGAKQLLAVDCIRVNMRRDYVYPVLHRLGMYALTSVNRTEKTPLRFLLPVSDPELFTSIKNMYEKIISPEDVSVVFVDLKTEMVSDELVFLNEKGIRPFPIFAAAPLQSDDNYIRLDDICISEEENSETYE